MHKLKAEALARSQCEKGVAVYLAQQHGKHRNKSVAYGLLGGLAGSVILMVWGQIPKGSMAFIPLVVGLVGGMATGLATQDNNDAEREMTFQDVCSQYDEDEEDELAEDDVEEDDEDGGSE